LNSTSTIVGIHEPGTSLNFFTATEVLLLTIMETTTIVVLHLPVAFLESPILLVIHHNKYGEASLDKVFFHRCCEPFKRKIIDCIIPM
jgi:hypothetical protein